MSPVPAGTKAATSDPKGSDTSGFIEHPFSFVDKSRTPYTKQLLVTERWKITTVAGADAEAAVGRKQRHRGPFTVDDPGAFTMQWGGMTRYCNQKGSMEKFVCAENNGNHLAAEKYVMPQAKAPDF